RPWSLGVFGVFQSDRLPRQVLVGGLPSDGHAVVLRNRVHFNVYPEDDRLGKVDFHPDLGLISGLRRPLAQVGATAENEGEAVNAFFGHLDDARRLRIAIFAQPLPPLSVPRGIDLEGGDAGRSLLPDLVIETDAFTVDAAGAGGGGPPRIGRVVGAA